MNTGFSNGNDEQNDMNGNDSVFGGSGQPVFGGQNDDDGAYKASAAYRGNTQVDTFGLSGLAGPQPMMAKGQQQTGIMMESVGMQMGGLGGFDSAPLSFGAPPMSAMKPTIQVLPS